MTGEQLQRLRQQGTAKFAEISSCHDGYLCHREANYQGVDMMTFRLTGQEKEKKNTAVPRCCGPRGTNITHIITKNNILLYPKEADFHLRQGTSLLWPADTILPAGFSTTSTGREACLLQKDKPYSINRHVSDC